MKPTPEQVRMALAGLNATRWDARKYTGVHPATLSRYQSGLRLQGETLERIGAGLIEMGAEFIEVDGKVGVLVPYREERGQR